MKREVAASGHPVWRAGHGPVEVRFVGRGPGDHAAAAAAARVPPAIAWSRQVHSARVLDAVAGPCGEGDALLTRRAGLALSVVTADCVPVLIAGEAEIASAHAGWRGIVAGVLPATLARLAIPGDRLTAWLGPAIGPCCYEVGEEVAARVAEAGGAEVVRPGSGSRPHLDLHGAVSSQLRAGGVRRIHRVRDCTRCSPDSLWSYRREGPGAGRNLAFIWMAGSAGSGPS